MLIIRKALAVLGFLALACLLSRVAVAGDRGCSRCGCAEQVKRVCRPVCTTKKITITRWEVVCEDFCVPRIGDCRGEHRCHGGCQSPCADVCTRKKLMKKTIIQEVPVTEWVVQYVCQGCRWPSHGDDSGR